VNVNVKMLLSPAPQKFNTFNTFNTFAIFAKFANFTPAPAYPLPVHRQASTALPIRERPFSTPHPLSCLQRAGYPRSGWRARGVRAVGGKG
jgi:hypothetical protein